jgi:hypothetical protein
MDLSLATTEQIDAELSRREIPFRQIVSAKTAEENTSEAAIGTRTVRYSPAP